MSFDIPLVNLLAGHVELQAGHFPGINRLVLKSLDSPFQMIGKKGHHRFRLEIRHGRSMEKGGCQRNLAVGNVFLVGGTGSFGQEYGMRCDQIRGVTPGLRRLRNFAEEKVDVEGRRERVSIKKQGEFEIFKGKYMVGSTYLSTRILTIHWWPAPLELTVVTLPRSSEVERAWMLPVGLYKALNLARTSDES